MNHFSINIDPHTFCTKTPPPKLIQNVLSLTLKEGGCAHDYLDFSMYFEDLRNYRGGGRNMGIAIHSVHALQTQFGHCIESSDRLFIFYWFFFCFTLISFSFQLISFPPKFTLILLLFFSCFHFNKRNWKHSPMHIYSAVSPLCSIALTAREACLGLQPFRVYLTFLVVTSCSQFTFCQPVAICHGRGHFPPQCRVMVLHPDYMGNKNEVSMRRRLHAGL